MDDSCAVCAENLEWVAYGSCGHRDLCSTCVVRLRFICQDRRCCICKTESPVIFITKALGDYTRTISDFSTFPSEPREGRVGSFWYHEDNEAFFDDVDHYRMIKAMCRLSCSVCVNMEDQQKDRPRHRVRFKSVEQLKGHLYHKHNLHMCSLCLEGRKVFVCEQKLYARAQLNQHTSTGDSEVDGSESERGGFMGHPMCQFCRTPFYGDNELYTHMSTEHYTCHICQGQHPGQYEYYKNYDDLEIHFRRDHYLCEDESCLAKKFTVFQSEAELKRHNAVEHGGKMSRSQRTAALQIPTSFRYHRSNERDTRRGRARTIHRESVDNDLAAAIQASMGTSRTEGARNEPTVPYSEPYLSDNPDSDYADPLVQSFDSLSTTDGETSSRYLHALGHSSRIPLGESSFPPLSMPQSSDQPNSRQNQESLPSNTMAAHLRRKTIRSSNKKAGSSGQAWPNVNRGVVLSSSTSGSSSGPGWPDLNRGFAKSSGTSGSSSASAWPAVSRGLVQTPVVSSQNRPNKKAASTRHHAPATQSVLDGNAIGPARSASNTSTVPHSASAPNLSDKRLFEPSDSDFPSVSATQTRRPATSTQAPQPEAASENVHTANKSLVENIRASLGHDEELYTAFKEISGQYRQGLIDASSYLEYVRSYGLSHLVLDLARLCPEVSKQRELIETHNASFRKVAVEENGWAAQSNSRSKNNGSVKKDKGKAVNVGGSSNSRDALADDFMSTVRKLQSSYTPHEEDADKELSKDKDAYRSSKGKSMVTMVDEQSFPKVGATNDSSSSGRASENAVTNSSKQKKKTPKFDRVRLGDGSMASLLNRHSDAHLEPEPKETNGSNGNEGSATSLPVRGVWRKGGGSKLFS